MERDIALVRVSQTRGGIEEPLEGQANHGGPLARLGAAILPFCAPVRRREVLESPH